MNGLADFSSKITMRRMEDFESRGAVILVCIVCADDVCNMFVAQIAAICAKDPTINLTHETALLFQKYRQAALGDVFKATRERVGEKQNC